MTSLYANEGARDRGTFSRFTPQVLQLRFQLWCILVDHDHEVNHIMGEAFIVDIPHEATVAELKKQRIMLHKPLIQFVNHNSLVVWKRLGLNVPGGDDTAGRNG